MAITRVQEVSNGTSGTTSPSVSWPGATTGGNFLVAAIGLSLAGNVSGTVSMPSPWFLAEEIRNETNNAVSIWVINNAVSRSGAETWTLDLVNDATVFLLEYSGITNSTALDQTVSTTGSSTTTASGTTGTTSDANELLLAVIANRNNTVQTSPTNSFAEVETAQSTNGTLSNRVNTHVYERIVSATGSYSTSSSLASSRPWSGAIITAIGEAAAGGAWNYGYEVRIG